MGEIFFVWFICVSWRKCCDFNEVICKGFYGYFVSFESFIGKFWERDWVFGK